MTVMHVYEVRPRKDKRGFDLISDVLPLGRMWYGELDAIANAIGFLNLADLTVNGDAKTRTWLGFLANLHNFRKTMT